MCWSLETGFIWTSQSGAHSCSLCLAAFGIIIVFPHQVFLWLGRRVENLIRTHTLETILILESLVHPPTITFRANNHHLKNCLFLSIYHVLDC